MSKADRQKIFDMYGGRCAYCGCELTKGWHVDELEPVVRNRKWIAAHWSEGIKGKWVADGCQYPENFNIKNQKPACASCNINKHSMSLEDFRESIAAFMKHLNEINTQYKIAKRYRLVTETGKPVVFYFETITPI